MTPADLFGLRDDFLAWSNQYQGIRTLMATRIAVDLDHFARLLMDGDTDTPLSDAEAHWILVRVTKEPPAMTPKPAPPVKKVRKRK